MDQPKEQTSKGHTRTRSAVKVNPNGGAPLASTNLTLSPQLQPPCLYGRIIHALTLSAATRPRSSTKGPLDVDDVPLTSPGPLSPQQAQRMALPTQPRSPGPTSPLPRSAAQSPVPRRPAPRPKDFSFLLRPENYHPLTPLNVPAAFRSDPSKQPTPETPIPDLLARGQFRAAAIAATNALTGPDAPAPSDHARIFSLLYTRLACLTLIDGTSIAAQEVKALEDLNSVVYVDEATGEHLVPWELRVLNVRLQALGFGDPRRAVMSYYDLAREARARLAAATAKHDNSARELWKDRLADVGVRVAGALVEMDDLTGAAHHLGSLPAREGGKLAMAKALLWLHLGDVGAARRCVKVEEAGETAGKVVDALCDMADGEYEAALARWGELKDESEDEMIGVNMAVCLLYVGRMQEGKALLEELVTAGRSSHTLLFNLTTMYELCTERARSLKVKLSERVAAMDESANGWEKSNADFKL
ncbi:hypothetical protein B0T16DRAFT_220526 [Cercophora newfieldiana]|uniref:Trafficking protein particle complex subunit 12 n=1 Tax=Cercophora newfieldiana TaxID=92897 RepID=A0AA40CKG7_9PEZI|nr:hypothetical protein B0T16DRAFT_220526 [Cercophora newfieldiana]